MELIERNDDGWWFVKIGNEEGWAPSTYIEERRRSLGDGAGSGVSRPPFPTKPKPLSSTTTFPASTANKQPEAGDEDPAKPKPRPRPRKATATFYRAMDTYDVPAYEDSGLPVVKGRVYELKEKNDGGWWLMKDGDIEGWAPSTYFKHL